MRTRTATGSRRVVKRKGHAETKSVPYYRLYVYTATILLYYRYDYKIGRCDHSAYSRLWYSYTGIGISVLLYPYHKGEKELMDICNYNFKVQD